MRTSINMLRELIPFDAVQLLRIETLGRPQEIFRQGYSSNTAWALAHMFPQKYPWAYFATRVRTSIARNDIDILDSR